MPAAFFPGFAEASMHRFRVNKPLPIFHVPLISIKEQPSLQKQIQGLLSFEERMILPKEKN